MTPGRAGERGSEADPWRLALASWAAAVSCGVVLWFVALGSRDFDWFISEAYAHIVYSALVRYHEFPYFSFHLNQGSYLVQDPWNPTFSITTPLVLLFGPESGLRFAAFAWGIAGYWAYFLWVRRRLSAGASIFSAMAWTLGLGSLWRIAVGNDMFLWCLALPAFLLLGEAVLRSASPRAAAGLGVLTGACLLAPTFHSIVYLFAPVAALWLAFVAFTKGEEERPSARRVLVLLAFALVVAAGIAAPRVAAWTMFDMRRFIPHDGAMTLGDAVESLLSFGKASAREYQVITGQPEDAPQAYGIWESSVALHPLATALAFVGLFASLFRRPTRKLLWFAIGCVAVGLLLTTSLPLWHAIRALSPGLRVSRRFLVTAAFGLSVLAGMGYAVVEERWAARRRWIAGIAAAAALLSVASWIRAAQLTGLLLDRPGPVLSHPAPPLQGVPVIISSRASRVIGEGAILADAFHSPGNPCEGESLWGSRCSTYARRIELAGLAVPGAQLSSVARSASPVTITHTTVTIDRIAPHDVVVLNLLANPLTGYEISTEPAGGKVALFGRDEQLVVGNRGDTPVEYVRLTPRPPVPGSLWLLSVAALLGATAVAARRRPSRRGPLDAGPVMEAEAQAASADRSDPGSREPAA